MELLFLPVFPSFVLQERFRVETAWKTESFFPRPEHPENHYGRVTLQLLKTVKNSFALKNYLYYNNFIEHIYS